LIAYLICLLFAVEAVPVYANTCRGRDETRFSRLFQLNGPQKNNTTLTKKKRQKTNKQKKHYRNKTKKNAKGKIKNILKH